MFCRTILACVLACVVPNGAAWAQILVGQTAGFTGAVAPGVKETTDGTRLYLDAVNARGGVGGQRIELISLDDRFDPKLAAENARRLLVERKVVALFLSRGTPHTEAIAPVAAEFKAPLIAPSTGAMSLHQPVHPYILGSMYLTPHEMNPITRPSKEIGRGCNRPKALSR